MAEDDVTDLTEDGEPEDSGGKGKRKKKEKAPKEPKGEKGGKEKEPKVRGEKKGGAVGVVVLMILVIFLLVGGFGAALYFDALGARLVVANAINDQLIDLVIWLDPEFNSVDARMRAEAAARDERLAEREIEMDEWNMEVEARAAILDSLDEQMTRRENEIMHREAQFQAMLERSIPLHRRDMTEEELEDMLSLSDTYSQMPPGVAAGIMVELHDPRDVAGLLYFMNERNRAAILEAMDERFAAHVTEILLYY